MTKKILKKCLIATVFILGLGAALPAMAGTGVFVNGVELTPAQWVQAYRMVGQRPVPGHYWYDARTGAWGPIGRGQARRGGDRFWSTRFSAGNSTADGSQGYVSVPGYGPVGFGM